MHTYSKWRESLEFFAPTFLMNTDLKCRIFFPFPKRLIIPYMSMKLPTWSEGYKMINIDNHKFTAPIVLEPKRARIEMYGRKKCLVSWKPQISDMNIHLTINGACQESVGSFHLIKEFLYSMIYIDFTTYPSTAQTYQIFWLHSKSLLLAPITEMSSISINNP